MFIHKTIPIYAHARVAAGGMYAYLFGEMSKMGYDILGESQLVGSPPIPEWDIPDAQFSGVSMLNWTTGRKNIYICVCMFECEGVSDCVCV